MPLCVLRQAQDEVQRVRHLPMMPFPDLPHPELVEGRTMFMPRRSRSL